MNAEASADRTLTVLLYGVPRADASAAESIKVKMVQPCLDAGWQVRIISSFNDVGVINNPRTGERDSVVPYRNYFNFDANETIVKKQNDEDIVAILDICRKYRDVYKNDYYSVRNALHQLSSLRRSWDYLEASETKSDVYMFLRPDLVYHDAIDIASLAEKVSLSNGVALPFWHAWNGVNDRLALASAFAAEKIARRLDLVSEFCEFRKLFHPEQLLKYAIRKNNIKVFDIGVTASRVRANGKINKEDFSVAMYKSE